MEEARQTLLATVVLEAKEKGDMNKYMTPQRVNRYMAWLRHLLNGVVREGKLANNPVLKLTMYKAKSSQELGEKRTLAGVGWSEVGLSTK